LSSCTKKGALIELQKRASQGGASASTTVIEALFPDVPVKKKTAVEKAEIQRWLAIRREEALKIDPETAEVFWTYAQTLDPYGVKDEWELPEEFHQVGREYFTRAPGRTYGSSLEICRAKPEISCGTDTVGNSPFLLGLRVFLRMAPKSHFEWRSRSAEAAPRRYRSPIC
jgi:hypothetical protein